MLEGWQVAGWRLIIAKDRLVLCVLTHRALWIEMQYNCRYLSLAFSAAQYSNFLQVNMHVILSLLITNHVEPSALNLSDLTDNYRMLLRPLMVCNLLNSQKVDYILNAQSRGFDFSLCPLLYLISSSVEQHQWGKQPSVCNSSWA